MHVLTYVRTCTYITILYIQNYVMYSAYVHFMDTFVIAGLSHSAKDWVKMG